ncbi:hypothetical protein CFOL_v3_02850 [Cephalotus follicularis]|uniref:Uncharacterized protein n=1 Tax=Cephalotus follicularis TaxID=3775 RepID=A0A1Q3AUD5_CEPFO|nr:hypothetical protein CFOL_v3_02850 [Cephalotus follicularis]
MPKLWALGVVVFFFFFFLTPQAESQDDRSRAVCAGLLSPPASCPINCFRADPVCGADGVTYWCGCPDAACAGVEVAKSGYCEIGSNGVAASLPRQALLLVHILWLILLGFSLLFGLF